MIDQFRQRKKTLQTILQHARKTFVEISSIIRNVVFNVCVWKGFCRMSVGVGGSPVGFVVELITKDLDVVPVGLLI